MSYPVYRKYVEDDPFFAAGDLTRQSKYLICHDDECEITATIIRCNQPGCSVACTSMKQVTMTYQCRQCKHSYPTANTLSLHITEVHDSYFAAAVEHGKAMFGCVLADCPNVFPTRELRDAHVVQEHHFPINYKFDSWRSRRWKSNKTTQVKESKQNKPLCRFYRAPEGCRYGKACKFRHLKSSSTNSHSSDDVTMEIDEQNSNKLGSESGRKIPKDISFGHRRKNGAVCK